MLNLVNITGACVHVLKTTNTNPRITNRPTHPSHTTHIPTEFVHALRIARTSGYIMLFTFACTLFLSLDDGLVYGVAASLAMLLYQLSNVRASFHRI